MSPYGVALTVGLLALAVPLVALARRLRIPYPVLLVAGGLFLGFVPGLPQVRLDPDLVLVVFLPPLLYWEALTAPIHEMRANGGHIFLLAIGLALFTAAAVAAVAHATIGLSWPLAFVLGAIVAPTDELAAVVVMERVRLPRYLVAVVEGESLLNDGSALIVYGIAVSAALGGAFHPLSEAANGVLAIVGGTILGFVVARLTLEGWRRFRDADLQRTISFIIPFVAYASAQALRLSGVLATVCLGVAVNRGNSVVLTSTARLQGAGYWETVVFLANALLYLLLGLQLHGIMSAVLAAYPLATLLGYAVIVNVVVIVVRFGWLVAQEYVPAIGGATEHPEPNPRHAMIVAWSGMRGAVSLAAALALPAALSVRDPSVRELIAFLAFSVILVTLVAGGLTLPLAVRLFADPAADDKDARELRRGAAAMAEVARRRVDALHGEGAIDDQQALILRTRYAPGAPGSAGVHDDHVLRRAELQVIEAERRVLGELWRSRAVDNTVRRRLERTLDLIEERVRADAAHRHHADPAEAPSG